MSGGRARIMAFLSSDPLRPVFVIVVVFILWQLSVSLFKIPPYLLPTPSSVAGQLVSEWPRLWRETLVTTYATLGGFALSVLFGVPLGVAVVSSRLVESLVYPILVFSQSVPKVAVAPLFVVWFGFGILPKVVVAFLLGFFPIVVATVIGLKSIEPEVLDLARSMNASALAAFVKIRLPSALPSIFGGLKVSITLCVVGAVVGEFVGSNSGIGYLLQIANGNFDLPLMFAALFLLSMLGVLLFTLIDIAERLAIPWHASQRSDRLAALTL
ncbi:NitT/TauT family transport system permease protein [Rhizobiales bacterium GAS191]|nr:NitT/TauT family transport system permease protein [Rhizobiales bacterium GAS191]